MFSQKRLKNAKPSLWQLALKSQWLWKPAHFWRPKVSGHASSQCPVGNFLKSKTKLTDAKCFPPALFAWLSKPAK